MGHVTEGMTITVKTLVYGFNHLSNKSALYCFALLIAFFAVYILFRISFYCIQHEDVRTTLGILLLAISGGLVGLILIKVIKDQMSLNFGSCWQSDYFVAFTFFLIIFPYVFLKYVTSGATSEAMGEFYKGSSIIIFSIIYALFFAPMYVWGIGQGEGVWDQMEDESSVVVFAQTSTFMYVLLYFLILGFWTKGHWISTLFPIVAFNGATMFYYEFFPMAVINGLIANGVFLIYLIGDKLLSRAFESSRANTSILVLFILAYYVILFAFWPALAYFYCGSWTGHQYTSFHSSSFY